VPNSSLQSSSAVRVSPQDVAAARMSAACGNVRAVVATSALANQRLLWRCRTRICGCKWHQLMMVVDLDPELANSTAGWRGSRSGTNRQNSFDGELHRQLPFWTSLCSMALAWNTKAAADCKAGRQKYCSCKALLRVVEEYR
jgi:hypothetical protein